MAYNPFFPDMVNPNTGTAESTQPTTPATSVPVTPEVASPTVPGTPAFDLSTLDFSFLKPSESTTTGYSSSTGNTQSQGSSSSNSNSYTGLNATGNNWLNSLMGSGEGSMQGQIDQWAGDLLKKYRITQDQTLKQMNDAANMNASRGIMHGTQPQNLRSNMLAALVDQNNQQQLGVLTDAYDKKVGSITDLLNLAKISNSQSQSGSNNSSVSQTTSSGDNSSYSTSPTDYQIIADMVRAGFTG